ncbi:hypothetical protein BDY19DRAFT_1053881 [Irpex rosettiformis]|uniref:Uncharacterized protein n=1 Tax=Irpex rosettiformis TaxID=378272 RepID=A0ACB8UHB9_9APHY|nr:hypothetical protein BDY19DRAFT_1053881 [Irpex rosettiformis]
MKTYRKLFSLMGSPSSYGSRMSLQVVRHTVAGYMDDLPVELLIDILLWLSERDLVRCRMVSRRFRATIDEAPVLQYSLELWATGYQDNPGCALSSAEKLKKLKDTRESCKCAEWLNSCGTSLSSDILDDMVHKQYYGNLFVGFSKSRKINGAKLWSTVRCLHLEPTGVNAEKGQHVRSSDWTILFDHPAEAFAVDPSEHLLVLLNYKQRIINSLEWYYEIRLASLLDGTLRSCSGVTSLRFPAPIRHFQEIPGMQIEGDRLGIATPSLFAAERHPSRVMHLTIINHVTGYVETHLTKNHYHGIEFAAFSFIFVTRSSLIMAVPQSDCFTLELHVLEPNTAQDADTPYIALHIRTYKLPQYKPARTSTESTPSMTRTYYPSMITASSTCPFSLSPSSALLHLRRRYVGHEQWAKKPSHMDLFIPISMFIDAIEQSRDAAILRIVQWAEWGPTHSRLFVFNVPQTIAGYGPLVLIGHTLLDFTPLDLARDVCRGLTRRSSPFPTSKLSVNLPQLMRRKGSPAKRTDETTQSSGFQKAFKSESLPRYTIVSEPSCVPNGVGSIFLDEVTTSLPYRTIDTGLEGSQSRCVWGGEVWVSYSMTSATQPSDSAVICYPNAIR